MMPVVMMCLSSIPSGRKLIFPRPKKQDATRDDFLQSTMSRKGNFRRGSMNRRAFLIGTGLAGGTMLAGGVLWGRTAFARHKLTEKLVAAATPELTHKAHTELERLPVKAREEIRDWFHRPCLNSAEFVYDICSHSFAERLAACPTNDLKEMCLLNAFLSKVVSDTEILNRVRVISEEIGNELDLGWAACCENVSNRWGICIKPYGCTVPNDLVKNVEPLIRESLRDAIKLAAVAGQKPAIGETIASIGISAIRIFPILAHLGIALPVFVLLALHPLFTYIMGQINNKIGDYQLAISERIALLGDRVGTEFEAEIRARLADLHQWQEEALQHAAKAQAEHAIPVF
jgi:hypothetical protein